MSCAAQTSVTCSCTLMPTHTHTQNVCSAYIAHCSNSDPLPGTLTLPAGVDVCSLVSRVTWSMRTKNNTRTHTRTCRELMSSSSMTPCFDSLMLLIIRVPRKDLLQAKTALWALNSSPSTLRVMSHSCSFSYSSCRDREQK